MRWMNGFCFPGFGGASATRSTAGVSVAVNRHVCRSFGRISKRYDSSGANEGVSSLSASSSTWEPGHERMKETGTGEHTRNLILDKSHSPEVLLSRSTMRPGVATTTCGLFPSSSACAIMSIPPTTTAVRRLRGAPRTANWSEIWKASSLRRARVRAYSKHLS